MKDRCDGSVGHCGEGSKRSTSTVRAHAASTMEPVRLIDAGLVSPQRSQAIYHAVAYATEENAPDTIIIASPTDPYVCIGFFQELDKEVDVTYCRSHDLPIVRREVGGGAVYLDKDQLFTQWVFRIGRLPARLEERFDLFVRPLVATYQDLGIDAYYRPVNDVHVAGKKISGTGAARIGDADVVVGSFMLDFDKSTMARVLKVQSEKMRDKVVEALEQYMTTMRELLPDLPSRDEIVTRYVRRCEEVLGRELVLGEHTQAELAKAEELDRLLTADEWVRQRGGFGRPYIRIHEDVRVAEVAYKVPGGLIRVTARLSGGTAENVEVSGDFTMVPASGLSAVEEALLGCALQREALERAVHGAYEAGALQSPGVVPADFAAAMLLLGE